MRSTSNNQDGSDGMMGRARADGLHLQTPLRAAERSDSNYGGSSSLWGEGQDGNQEKPPGGNPLRLTAQTWRADFGPLKKSTMTRENRTPLQNVSQPTDHCLKPIRHRLHSLIGPWGEWANIAVQAGPCVPVGGWHAAISSLSLASPSFMTPKPFEMAITALTARTSPPPIKGVRRRDRPPPHASAADKCR
ncbi:hypothetical protein AAFF_G00374480 [Aldrovandia affinis]|uniref:Uncharacterized protein n=1 Tax=Aldrovandia affinis TaxID=143900 RepID=A0AAD7SG02_9TELE|nr:hypothetical protein AAFF_G00374480 [Aldrovandia affinis]